MPFARVHVVAVCASLLGLVAPGLSTAPPNATEDTHYPTEEPAEKVYAMARSGSLCHELSSCSALIVRHTKPPISDHPALPLPRPSINAKAVLILPTLLLGSSCQHHHRCLLFPLRAPK